MWRWAAGAALVVMVLMVTLVASAPAVRGVDLPVDLLPVRTPDGDRLYAAWFGGQPGVIRVWLPG